MPQASPSLSGRVLTAGFLELTNTVLAGSLVKLLGVATLAQVALRRAFPWNAGPGLDLCSGEGSGGPRCLTAPRG